MSVTISATTRIALNQTTYRFLNIKILHAIFCTLPVTASNSGQKKIRLQSENDNERLKVIDEFSWHNPCRIQLTNI